MSTIIRTDISRILLLWALLGLGVWLGTPWGATLSNLIGPVWLWCGLIPGVTGALLYPRHLGRAVVRTLWLLMRAGRHLIQLAAGLLADCVTRLDWRSP